MARRNWPQILEHAAGVVTRLEAEIGAGVTLRQLFYQLVSDGTLRNTRSDYTSLSSHTAEARRENRFPDLLDRSRAIHQPASWISPSSALADLTSQYRRDRTEGQPYSIVLGVEKAGMLGQLSAWFDQYGVLIVPTGGYVSQTMADDLRAELQSVDRYSILLYAGDHDPDGWDIERDFIERVGCFDAVHRVALHPEQVERYGLLEWPGKPASTRAAGFVERFGNLVQVELDALPPAIMRRAWMDAFGPVFDMPTWQRVVERERVERAQLADLAASF